MILQEISHWWGVDNTIKESIYFSCKDLVNSEKIKSSSRSITKISGFNSKKLDISVEDFCKKLNKKLKKLRKDTNDVFLTPFKGLRKDGKYRRRLDFKLARLILNSASSEINYKKVKGLYCEEKS